MNEFKRKSLITNQEYNYFDCVKIKNLTQAAAYMENDVFPVDIRVVRNADNQRVLVYLFDRNEAKEVFDKWCNYELK